MLEITNKEITKKEIPLTPLRDMRVVKGELKELTEAPVGNTDDYIFAELTDEIEPIDAIGYLRSVYPNIMGMSYNNKRTAMSESALQLKSMGSKNSLELFEDFYMQQNATALSDTQREIVYNLLKELEGNS